MQSPLVRLLIFYALAVFISTAAQSELPEGEGKDVVEDTCTDCHSLRRIVIQRLDEEGWHGILREMLENGAAIDPDDMKTITVYLTKNFGPDRKVNVNKAEADEIGTALRLTSAEANAIVRYRAANGPLKDLGTLEKASGAPDKIDARKSLIEF